MNVIMVITELAAVNRMKKRMLSFRVSLFGSKGICICNNNTGKPQLTS
jgi:hypothetical protein